ncbi:MAG: carboxypeptidase-like regulatory domain-containing protein [Planctomycetota bacterium]
MRLAIVGVMLLVLAPSVFAEETGAIVGLVVDQHAQATNPGNAVVFLCDVETGMPIVSSTGAPMNASVRDLTGFDGLRHEVTSDTGAFRFENVPVGTYRLVAQSWSGMHGVPDADEAPSAFIVLHGVAEDVAVTEGADTRVFVRGLGDGVLKIVNDPPEEHAYLLVSTGRKLGDGVIGPAAWGHEFVSGIIGATRMEVAHVTLVGLPESAEIHVGLLNYDNNPGVGGDSYVVGQEPVVTLEVYATWSNGKFEPPARLAPLTDHLEAQDLSVSHLLGLEGSDRDNMQAFIDQLRADPDRRVHVEGVGEFTFADVLAASRHRHLRAVHRERHAR